MCHCQGVKSRHPRHTLTHPRSATDPFPSRTLHLHFRVSAHKCAPLCSGDDAWIHTNPPQGTGIDIVCSAHGAHVPHDGRSTQAGVAYVHCGKLTATRMQPEAPVWICCRGARLVSYVQSTAKLEMVKKRALFTFCSVEIHKPSPPRRSSPLIWLPSSEV